MTLDAKFMESIKEILPLAESFCKSVLHYLKTTTNLLEVPIIVKKQVDFNENKIVESSVLIRSYIALLQQKCPITVLADFEESRPLIHGLIDAKILRMRSMSDIDGNSIEPTFDNDFLWLLNIFQNLIIEYIETEKTLDYHSDKFATLFELWVKDQITPTWSEVTIPLIGFTSSINQADVIDGFKICAFSNESKSKFFNEAQSISFFYQEIEFYRVTHYLTVDCKQDGNNEENTRLSAKDIVTGLRLIQEGLIGARAIFFFRHPRRKKNNQISSSMDIFNVTTPDERYKFLNADINPLIEIVSHLKKVSEKQDKYLNIALRRFNLSYTRNLPEDRLIDWTISLESTILADINSELKYRLALRGSFLLRKIRNPKETEIILKTMYDMRSKVVHEGLSIHDCVKNDGKIAKSHSSKDFLSLAENVTREILREYVRRSILENKNVPSINQEIDEQLLELMSV